MFGLSQPSLNAECEKINLTGSSKESNLSLSFIIKSYASSSSDKLVFLSILPSIACPFLSIENLKKRTGINKKSIEALQLHGCLDGMDESDQMTLF
jgi:hypothetical protein